jgi:hypothetical protein
MNGEVNIANQPIIYKIVDAIWDTFSEKLGMDAFVHHWPGIDRERWVAIQMANRNRLIQKSLDVDSGYLMESRIVLWLYHIIPELIDNEEARWPNFAHYGNYLTELTHFFNTVRRMPHPPATRKRVCACAVQ